MTNYKIKKLHKSDRPREKIVKHGVEFLNTSELLAVLVGSGYEGKNVIQLSKGMLSKYHSKNGILRQKDFGQKDQKNLIFLIK